MISLLLGKTFRLLGNAFGTQSKTSFTIRRCVCVCRSVYVCVTCNGPGILGTLCSLDLLKTGILKEQLYYISFFENDQPRPNIWTTIQHSIEEHRAGFFRYLLYHHGSKWHLVFLFIFYLYLCCRTQKITFLFWSVCQTTCWPGAVARQPADSIAAFVWIKPTKYIIWISELYLVNF